jgi:hypothetical protein
MPNGGNALQTLSLANSVPFPILNLLPTGGEVATSWDGLFGNDSAIVNGRYTHRIGALKPFGDRSVDGDWETFVIDFVVERN